MDINSQDYREKLLEENGLGNIDDEGSLLSEVIVSEQDIFNKRSLDLIGIPNLDFSLDKANKRIDAYSGKKHIGEIYEGNYHINEFSTIHIGIEINSNYKRKGLGTFLYLMYEEEFGLPEEEYSRQKSKHIFFISIGYIPVEIINDITGERFDYTDDKYDYIGDGYSCKYIKE